MPLIAQERAVSYTGAVYPEHDICSGFFINCRNEKGEENGRGNRNGKMVMSKKKQ